MKREEIGPYLDISLQSTPDLLPLQDRLLSRERTARLITEHGLNPRRYRDYVSHYKRSRSRQEGRRYYSRAKASPDSYYSNEADFLRRRQSLISNESSDSLYDINSIEECVPPLNYASVQNTEKKIVQRPTSLSSVDSRFSLQDFSTSSSYYDDSLSPGPKIYKSVVVFCPRRPSPSAKFCSYKQSKIYNEDEFRITYEHPKNTPTTESATSLRHVKFAQGVNTDPRSTQSSQIACILFQRTSPLFLNSHTITCRVIHQMRCSNRITLSENLVQNLKLKANQRIGRGQVSKNHQKSSSTQFETKSFTWNTYTPTAFVAQFVHQNPSKKYNYFSVIEKTALTLPPRSEVWPLSPKIRNKKFLSPKETNLDEAFKKMEEDIVKIKESQTYEHHKQSISEEELSETALHASLAHLVALIVKLFREVQRLQLVSNEIREDMQFIHNILQGEGIELPETLTKELELPFCVEGLEPLVERTSSFYQKLFTWSRRGSKKGLDAEPPPKREEKCDLLMDEAEEKLCMKREESGDSLKTFTSAEEGDDSGCELSSVTHNEEWASDSIACRRLRQSLDLQCYADWKSMKSTKAPRAHGQFKVKFCPEVQEKEYLKDEVQDDATRFGKRKSSKSNDDKDGILRRLRKRGRRCMHFFRGKRTDSFPLHSVQTEDNLSEDFSIISTVKYDDYWMDC